MSKKIIKTADLPFVLDYILQGTVSDYAGNAATNNAPLLVKRAFQVVDASVTDQAVIDILFGDYKAVFAELEDYADKLARAEEFA
jgi:hypothetical protein